jgi:hypothetical protein
LRYQQTIHYYHVSYYQRQRITTTLSIR